MTSSFLTTRIPGLFSEFLADEAGQDIVEYSLLLTLIAALSVSVLTLVGINITRLFEHTRTLLLTASNNLKQIEMNLKLD